MQCKSRRLLRRSKDRTAREIVPGLLGSLLVAVAGLACAAEPDGAAELLKKADDTRTSNFVEFTATVESVEKLQSGLSPTQREYLRYLEGWKSAYEGDTQTAIARLTTLIEDGKDVTLRLRAGATAVNVLVFAKRYEEAYTRLADVLHLLPEVSDGGAREQALLNAAELYNGVGQYELALGYAQQVIDANWGGHGFCKGWEPKLQALYESGQVKSVGPELRTAIDSCVNGLHPAEQAR